MRTDLPIVGPMPHTPEWDAMRFFDADRERPIVFGASEALDACNAGYRSGFELYLEKLHEIPREEDTEQSRRKKKFGHRLETPIIEEYAEESQTEVVTGLPMFFSSVHSFMAATPDAFAISGTPGIRSVAGPITSLIGLTAILDIVKHGVDAKNSTTRMFDRSGEDENKFGAEGTDQVPLGILFQAQQLCAVLKLTAVEFPTLMDGYYLRTYRVERNDDLIATIADAEKELAERIINRDPPEPNYRHSKTKKVLERLYGCVIGSVRTLAEEHRQAFLRWEQVKLDIKSLEEEEQELKNKLLFAAGDAQFVEFEESDIRLKRVIVADSVISQADVDAYSKRLGQVGRRGHTRLQRAKK